MKKKDTFQVTKRESKETVTSWEKSSRAGGDMRGKGLLSRAMLEGKHGRSYIQKEGENK